MTVREAWKLEVPIQGAWLIVMIGSVSWMAFDTDRPLIGGAAVLLGLCILTDYVGAFALRRIEELAAQRDGDAHA